jgi:hypothetical protein
MFATGPHDRHSSAGEPAYGSAIIASASRRKVMCSAFTGSGIEAKLSANEAFCHYPDTEKSPP